MLRKVLQRSIRPVNRQALLQPVANRFFSIHAAKQQESETLKPTSGKNIVECVCV
jgi:hypothetical protein